MSDNKKWTGAIQHKPNVSRKRLQLEITERKCSSFTDEHCLQFSYPLPSTFFLPCSCSPRLHVALCSPPPRRLTIPGPMVWYQKFEYAVGHWLQKTAEHVFGCVLCSPGCFSLFRGSALMDDNVLKRYTTTAKRRQTTTKCRGTTKGRCFN